MSKIRCPGCGLVFEEDREVIEHSYKGSKFYFVINLKNGDPNKPENITPLNCPKCPSWIEVRFGESIFVK